MTTDRFTGFMCKKRKTPLVSAVLFVIIQCPVSSAAEDSLSSYDDLFQLSLEELINVPIKSTSLFTETSLDAGSTVTVITQDYWQKRGARRLHDAVSYMPGFTPLPQFLGVKQWAIRGFVSSNGSGIQTLWDGVPINTYPVGTAQLDHPEIQLNTLNRIEVIRGPGSALYGADAFHGVVSLDAFESDSDEQQIALRAASNKYGEGAYRISTTVFSDWRANLALSASGQSDQEFEYRYIDSGETKTNEREYRYRNVTSSFKLASNKNDVLAYKFGFYYNKYSHDDFFHDGASVPANDSSDLGSNLTMVKGEAKWMLNNHSSLTLDASYWTEEHDFHRILSPANNRINIFVDEETQLSSNLVYRHENFMGNTELSLALSHRKNEVDNAYRTIKTAAGVETLNVPLSFGFKSRDINSLLLDGKTRLFDRQYILRYGFRYDDYSDFGTQFSPRLGLIKKLNSTSVLKLLYGNAFRAPTGNQLYGSPFIEGNLDLNPEEIDTLELVFLSQSRTSKFEAVIFASKWENTIVPAPNPPQGRQHQNRNESESYGIELSYLRQFDRWQLDTNGSYVVSEDKTDNLDYSVFPTYIFNLGLSYQFRHNWQALVNNRVLLDMTQNPDTANQDAKHIRDYWRVDVNITKTYRDNWEVYANVRNLLNRNNQFPSTANSANQANFVGGIQDEEISLDVGFRYNF